MFEYQVIPAPRKGKKAKGVKGSDLRFAHAMEEVLNEAAQEGWEYVRADTLPSEERSGLTSRTTVYQNMLVFRRPIEVEIEDEVEEAEEQAAAIADVDDVDEHHAPSLPSAQDANEPGDNAPFVRHTDI